MRILLVSLAGLAELAGLICWIVILVHAFQDEFWKGLLFFLCCFYAFYYGLIEFDHQYKWPLVIGMIGGHGIALTLIGMIR